MYNDNELQRVNFNEALMKSVIIGIINFSEIAIQVKIGVYHNNFIVFCNTNCHQYRVYCNKQI